MSDLPISELTSKYASQLRELVLEARSHGVELRIETENDSKQLDGDHNRYTSLCVIPVVKTNTPVDFLNTPRHVTATGYTRARKKQ